MSSEARPPIFRMAREDVWEFPRPNMDLVPELIKYSAATVAVVARNVVGTPSTFFNGVAAKGTIFWDRPLRCSTPRSAPI